MATFALCLQYTSSDGTYILVTYVTPTNLVRRYTCHWTRYNRKRLRIKYTLGYKQLLGLSGFAIYALIAGQRPQMHILERGYFPTGEASSPSCHGSRIYHTWSYYSWSRWPTVFGLGLWPLASWDCGFESQWGHGSLFFVSVVCVCVWSDRCLCDGPIPRPEESYRAWVCLEGDQMHL